MEFQKKSIENVATSDSNFAPTFIDTSPLPDVKFNGHFSINKILDSAKVINIYVSCICFHSQEI